MLNQDLDVWNIHRTPIDWDFVHKNYSQVIVGGAGLLHSVFEKFWVDVDKNCKLDRKSTRLNSSHSQQSRMPSSA